MTEQTPQPVLELSEDDEEDLIEGLSEGKDLLQDPARNVKSLHWETKISRYASLYIETLQWRSEAVDDFELLLFLDWKLLPDQDEAPMSIGDISSGVPSVVKRIKEIVAQETGCDEKEVYFDLTDNLLTQAIYSAFIVVDDTKKQATA
jgi:hypothetical protein